MFITSVFYVKRISQSLEAVPSVSTITLKAFEINYTGKVEVQLSLIDCDFVSKLNLVVNYPLRESLNRIAVRVFSHFMT